MNWMLWLYPHGWRQRYGEEVAMLVASEKRSFRLFLDLLAGAIDARLNPQWIPASSTTKGSHPMTSIKRLCSHPGFSASDQRLSAALMLGSSLVFALVGLGLTAVRQVLFGQAVLYAAFPMAVILSSKSTYLKAYSRPVGWILMIGGMVGMFLFMLAVTYVAERT